MPNPKHFKCTKLVQQYHFFKNTFEKPKPINSNQFPDCQSVHELIIPASVCMLSGGPGSGKSVQCERMEERFGLHHVTLGELLCTELQANSDRGRYLQDILERGEQLPEVRSHLCFEYFYTVKHTEVCHVNIMSIL